MTVPPAGRMPATCPECGAPASDGLACGGMLETILAWEYGDDDLRAEHFSTVAAYNLQHPAQFTAEALAGLRVVFIEHVDHGMPVAEIRRWVARAAGGRRRVRLPEQERRPVQRQWAVTIADVYHGGDPTGAADRVRAWAASVRRHLQLAGSA